MNPFVQELEGRRLLTATLTNGVLDVEGTKRNDAITVSLSADGTTINVSQAKYRAHGKTSTPVLTTFNASDVTSIVLNAGKGNDRVVFKTLGSTDFTTPATISLGDGNDWLTAGGGADSIDGGAGDDDIRAGAGNDTVNAGEGDDRVDGGAGADLINGDDGDDNLTGGTEVDTINGGDDDDTIHTAGDSAVDIVDGGTDSAETGEADQDTAYADTTDTVTNAVVDTTGDTGTGGDHGPGGDHGGFGGPGGGGGHHGHGHGGGF
jgi:Ca2+-binding RTX toxin-like protein